MNIPRELVEEMAKRASKPETEEKALGKQDAKQHVVMKQGRTAPRVSKEIKEATDLAIKMHRRALKALEKH
ncbi:MAG: hypothetical protein HYX93_02130 [Chloroflexi bacterium]|nr:hypothetical protein [Chloroflexota bacterium]